MVAARYLWRAVDSLNDILLLSLAHLFPQRLQIPVLQSHKFDLLTATHFTRLLQPDLRLLQPSQLAFIAGQIVGQDRVICEVLHHPHQIIPRFFGSLEFMQAIGPMPPPQRNVWHQFNLRRSRLQNPIPLLGFGVDVPANFKNARVIVKFWRYLPFPRGWV